mmetsp:Transcript_100325/g.178354  ORF Transcript_100325/g.178354 Transcript_100325/m.178354 type:complete len:93 (+) Transcript_100325:75-353(+)
MSGLIHLARAPFRYDSVEAVCSGCYRQDFDLSCTASLCGSGTNPAARNYGKHISTISRPVTVCWPTCARPGTAFQPSTSHQPMKAAATWNCV